MDPYLGLHLVNPWVVKVVVVVVVDECHFFAVEYHCLKVVVDECHFLAVEYHCLEVVAAAVVVLRCYSRVLATRLRQHKPTRQEQRRSVELGERNLQRDLTKEIRMVYCMLVVTFVKFRGMKQSLQEECLLLYVCLRSKQQPLS